MTGKKFLGFLGATYSFDEASENVKVVKRDGKVFYIPERDIVMLAAAMLRQAQKDRANRTDDYVLLGLHSR